MDKNDSSSLGEEKKEDFEDSECEGERPRKKLKHE